MIPFKPMLCSPQNDYYLDKFVDETWVVETKYDGERIIAERKLGKVHLWTRRELEVTHKFPEVVNALVKTLPTCDWIVDGELTVKGGFEKLLTRNTLNERVIQSLATSNPGKYHVFDVLKTMEYLMVKNAPLAERRGILDKLFTPNDIVDIAPQFGGSKARKHFDSVVGDDGEGVVVKHLESLYIPGYRHPLWMKFKKCETVDVQVIGATGSDALSFGALVMAVDGKYFGKVGTGFTDKQRGEILRVLESNPDTEDFSRWGVPEEVKREMVRVCAPLDAEVKILERHTGGRPRHPVWMRFKL